MAHETFILSKKHIFVSTTISLPEHLQTELDYIKKNFCGLVLPSIELDQIKHRALIYLTGDISQHTIPSNHKVFIVRQFSSNFDESDNRVIDMGAVPINIHEMGIYLRIFFPGSKSYFTESIQSHEFQDLTMSNLGGSSLRRGIYLSDVKKIGEDSIKYNLLRCSTNLSGPTDNFRQIDHEVIASVNEISGQYFKKPAPLNHVLAQIYNNSVNTGKRVRQKKAVIKLHSDKTKDMPMNGLIAFATFYDGVSEGRLNAKLSNFDYYYKDKSVLTKLHFKLKNVIEDKTLVEDFSVTLYPNSVFLIPLSTNCLYQHEIVPSTLPVNRIPTRLGYVIRCSNTVSIHTAGQTYIDRSGQLTALVDTTKEDNRYLKQLYLRENKSIDVVPYDNINYSMNTGDYKKPIV